MDFKFRFKSTKIQKMAGWDLGFHFWNLAIFSHSLKKQNDQNFYFSTLLGASVYLRPTEIPFRVFGL